MTAQNKIEAATDPAEAWRPALAAFYDANGQSQGAMNLRVYNMRLDASDRLTINALRAAIANAPRQA